MKAMTRTSARSRIVIGGAAAIALLISFVTAVVGQEDPLPHPTGRYPVGRTSFDWTDNNRVDLENANGRREIVVWVWYPAEQAGPQRAEWAPGLWGNLFAAAITSQPAPGKSADKVDMKAIRAYACNDVPLAANQNKYPVLIFAPGYGSAPIEYTALMEDLASRGYIVAGITPTYFTTYTAFSDGRIAGQHPMAREVAGAPRSAWADGSLLPSGDPAPISDAVFRLWTGDLRFCLDQLVQLNATGTSKFRGHLDLNRVGAFGHSIGAMATAQFAKDDARVGAALLIEGPLMGDVARDPVIAKPLMVMLASTQKGRDRASLPNRGVSTDVVALVRSGRPSYVVTVPQSSHPFPSDIALMPFATGRHDPNPLRSLTITRAYSAAFFDQHLLGRTSPLLGGPSAEYPDVLLEHSIVPKPKAP